MAIAFIGIGSDMGDRKQTIRIVLKKLSEAFKILKVSNVYETKPKIPSSRPAFLNCCIKAETNLDGLGVIKKLKEIESWFSTQGTNSRHHHGSVDCDLISLEGEVVRTPTLTLPHPEAHHRAFVMIPLSEIEPDWQHPILNESAQDLAKKCYWPGWGEFCLDGNTLLDF